MHFGKLLKQNVYIALDIPILGKFYIYILEIDVKAAKYCIILRFGSLCQSMLQFFMLAPYQTGFLNSKSGHKIFYSLYGNPKGQPVLVFHGGPGSHSKPKHVGALDLQKYHVIMFDQPGCGESEPLGTLKDNTTHVILEIAEDLLNHLNIWQDVYNGKQKLILKGRSWGATLALLFAIKHPREIKAILLQSVFMATRKAANYILENRCNKGVNLFLPERYSYIKSYEQRHNITLQKAIDILTISDEKFDPEDPRVKLATALLLRYYVPSSELQPSFSDFKPETVETPAVYSMRIFSHYDKNNYFLPDNYILKNAEKIRDIPIHIIHARYDLDCPIAYVYELVKKLPNTTFFISHFAGHRGTPEWDKIEANWLSNIDV